MSDVKADILIIIQGGDCLMNKHEIEKTLDIASAGTVLVDNDVDKAIQELIVRNNPLRANLPRRQGSGSQWTIVRRTAAGSGAWVNDTEEPTEQEGTYTQTTFPYKTILRRGKVTRKLQAQGMSYVDIEAQEITAALDIVRDTEEYGEIYGNTSSNSKQINGIDQLTPNSQRILMGANGAPLTITALDEAYDLCNGMPNMLVGSKRSRRHAQALLQAQQRFVDTTEVKGGFRLMSYNDVPYYWSAQISDAETQGDAENASSLFFVDTNYTWMGVLTELKFMRLNPATSQYTSFDIFEDVALVVSNTLYNSKIKGVIPS